MKTGGRFGRGTSVGRGRLHRAASSQELDPEYHAREQKADEDIGQHLAEEESKLKSKPIPKGIIWIENVEDPKTSQINKLVSNIDSIEKSEEDSNQNVTQYSWMNKDANRSYKLFFFTNGSYDNTHTHTAINLN